MIEGVLAAIGNTPLIRLNRVIHDRHFNLFAKLEGLNPGGSIKDRTAFSIIKHAMDQGVIKCGTTVVESSSGNMGIGLAQVCTYFGLPFICVVDPKTTKQNIRILEAYGAQVDMVLEPDPATGEYLQARIARVQTLLDTIENSFWPDQYSNIYNARAHHQTMREIDVALKGEIDYLFCTTSTCGTVRGCADYARQRRLRTKIWAVDAEGSVIFGHQAAKRLIPGHGAAIRPSLYRADLADRVIHVSDLDCIVGCHRLAKREAILVGGSSGGAIMAVEKTRKEIPENATCVVIFADRGERYLDTIYSKKWLNDNFDVTLVS
jgi:cysteine synthase A